MEQEETMPGRFELKPTLEKVWHAPDNFRFMDPLPPMHRRGIIIAAIVLVVGFLLPSDDTPNASVVTREAQLDSVAITTADRRTAANYPNATIPAR